MTKTMVVDRDIFRDLIRQRKKRGHDRYDEVWDGVYVMPSVPSLEHQSLVGELTAILIEVIQREKKGRVYPGANVSDRVKNWKRNYRVPDLVVVLAESAAVKYENHIVGGPDFLVEIRSPQEDPEAKLPFYSRINVRELLILERDTREVKLWRHNGLELAPADAIPDEKWLKSDLLPLAFRLGGSKAKPKLEIKRTDRIAGHWTI